MDQFFLSFLMARLIVNWPHRLRHSILRLFLTCPVSIRNEPNSFRYPSIESQSPTSRMWLLLKLSINRGRWRSCSSLVHLSLFTQRSLSLILSLRCILLSFLYFPPDTQLAPALWTKIQLGWDGIPFQHSLFIHLSWFAWTLKNNGGVRFLDWNYIVVIVFIHEINVVRFISVFFSVFLPYTPFHRSSYLFPFRTLKPGRGHDDDDHSAVISEDAKYIGCSVYPHLILCTTWANTCKHNEGALILFGGTMFDQCLYGLYLRID